MELQLKNPKEIKDVRARGLMLGLELKAGINAENIFMQLMDMGFLIGYKENVLRFMPPLIILRSQIDELIAALSGLLMKK